MVTPAFCTSCGRPLDGAASCPACAATVTPAAVGDAASLATPVSTAAYEAPAPEARPFEGRVLPTTAPYAASGGASANGAYAYGGAATGAPDLSRYAGMWNWGAFFLCPFWLMNHGAVPLGIVALLLSFVPFVNFVTSLGFGIFFGVKGNEWAASHRAFSSDAQFVAVQNAWRNWGIGLAILGFALSIVATILLGILHALVHATAR